MWIVALALRRPYTFVVMALLIIILTPIHHPAHAGRHFPRNQYSRGQRGLELYTGLSPQEMSDRIVTNSERGFTVTVNDIEHQESQSLSGIAVIKIFFRPSVNISMAVTQVTAMCQTVLRGLPAGTTPPLVITYTASSTPIVQLG
jgi:multidrug efflux pump subunit AcrB